MIAHLKYLRYVLIHKYFVYRAGRLLGLGHWQLIKHDWTKFQPIEWFAYVARMADNRNSTWQSKEDTPAYNAAWAHHWRNNEHHYEYWTVKNWLNAGSPEDWQSVDGVLVQRIPHRFVLEMAADKYGAGMAQGKPDIAGWWQANKHRHTLHSDSLFALEVALSRITELQQAGKL